jgi:GTP pyrophosphokinase
MVFTPKGEQKSIEKGATALDFAYAIHSHIGNKAIAAKINLRLMPLSHVLRTGDQVEINTAENEVPKREWLQFVKTSKARRAILDNIKSQRQLYIKIGKKMLEKHLHEIGKNLTDKVIVSLMEEFEIFDTKPEDMYFKIGCGMVVPDELENKLKKYFGINRESYFVISNSDANHKFVLATCCTPILGESVVGFKSSDGTITVHTRTCSNANNLAANTLALLTGDITQRNSRVADNDGGVIAYHATAQHCCCTLFDGLRNKIMTVSCTLQHDKELSGLDQSRIVIGA